MTIITLLRINSVYETSNNRATIAISLSHMIGVAFLSTHKECNDENS